MNIYLRVKSDALAPLLQVAYLQTGSLAPLLIRQDRAQISYYTRTNAREPN